MWGIGDLFGYCSAPARKVVGLTLSQLDMNAAASQKMYRTVQELRLTSLNSFRDANSLTLSESASAANPMDGHRNGLILSHQVIGRISAGCWVAAHATSELWTSPKRNKTRETDTDSKSFQGQTQSDTRQQATGSAEQFTVVVQL